MRSREGTGRHRQPEFRIDCPHCGLSCLARRQGRNRVQHIRAHLNDNGKVCPPLTPSEAKVIASTGTDPRFGNQLALF